MKARMAKAALRGTEKPGVLSADKDAVESLVAGLMDVLHTRQATVAEALVALTNLLVAAGRRYEADRQPHDASLSDLLHSLAEAACQTAQLMGPADPAAKVKSRDVSVN